MLVTVFTPQGIVVATSCIDSFYESIQIGDGTTISPINIEGLPHVYTFWGKYSLTYNCLNQFAYESTLLDEFNKLSLKWEKVPQITVFMPYLKKLFVDSNIQIIGVMAAYDEDENGILVPYVYQILGENINRINLDNEGHVNYNCVYLGKKTYIGRLLQQTKLLNGDIWEDNPAVRLRCDLYSINKSIDLCRFMLRTNHYADNINSALYDSPLKADISIITKEKIETKIIDI